MPSCGPRTAEELKTSCHLQCRNGLDLFSEFLLGALQIIALLQIEPEIRPVTAQLPEPQCQHCRHRLLFIKNVIERLTRHAKQLCDSVFGRSIAGKISLRRNSPGCIGG
jgi:hypothetical protein